MLEIIYGKSGSGKSLKLYNDIKENLSKEKIFFIVPEQGNLTAEQNLLHNLKITSLLNIEVLTLSRMASRILDEIGGNENVSLSKSGKAMIIYDILNKQKNNLKFLGKSDKNIDVSVNMITELKKHNINDNILEETNISDIYTKLKLDDIKLIYKEYNKKIESSFVDENDILTIVTDKIEESDLFKNSLVYIDDFNGFTPQEYKIFEKLIQICDKVTVTVSTDSLQIGEKESDIFYFNKVFAGKLIDIAKNNNSKVELIKCEKNYRLKNEELRFLEENLSLNEKSKQYENECNNIKLFLANNSYSELEYVAMKILTLVKNNNYRYSDIAVISDNLDNYSSEAKIVFDKYEIPIFIDEKKELNQNILIKYILAILDIFAKNWSFDSVFNFLKIGMSKMSDDDIYLLENYCKKWGIRNYKWFKEFNYEPVNELQERLEKIRVSIVEPLLKFKEEVSKNKTAKEITKCIYDFLIENNINVILDEKIKRIDDIEINNEYNTSYKILIKILDEIVALFGNQKITFENYRDLLQVGFSENELGKIPATQDQVILGDSSRSRNSNIKIAFIVGINDGFYPVNNKFEGYLNDKDREILKESGIELAKTSLDALYESNFEIYNVLSIAQEKLYLSYCSSDKDGKSIRPSILIKKIKRIFPSIEEKSDIISKEYDITNFTATFDDAIVMYKRFLDGEEISDEWKTVLSYYQINEREKFERTLNGINYTNKAEDISSENIQKLYGNKIKTSISRLEQYRQCPFSFHMKYGLKLKEKQELKLQTVDTGNFMHEVINDFFGILDERNLDIKSIDEEQIRKIVEDIIESFFQMSKYYVFSSTSKYKILTRKLRNIVLDSINYIVYSIKNSKFDVLGHEIEFSEKSKYKPIVMELENSKKVEITGKIDRVDIGKLNDKTFVRIIDYKSSVKDLDMNKVEAGLQIQLITYLDAISKQEDFNPSGVLYMGLLDSMIGGDKNLTDEEIKNEIKKKFRMTGVVIANIDVIRMMDSKLDTGSSDIIPVTIKKDGTLSSRSNAIKENEFDELQEKVSKIIKQISTEILDGKIDIKPYSYKTNTGCDYCEFKSICMFNPNLKQNTYNYIKKVY